MSKLYPGSLVTCPLTSEMHQLRRVLSTLDSAELTAAGTRSLAERIRHLQVTLSLDHQTGIGAGSPTLAGTGRHSRVRTA